MKLIFITYLILFLTAFNVSSQTDFNGVWQGIMLRDGYKQEQGTLLYATFSITGDILEGKMRDEIYSKDLFAVKKIKGFARENKLEISQFVIEKKKSASNTNWCNINATLSYNDSTGYLEGRYTSKECKGNNGKIILYKSSLTFSATEVSPTSQAWFNQFNKDYKKGLNAPFIRDLERANFKFQPIYFDYDKSEIHPEYEAFLLKMVRVVEGHTDLRIKVTGNTDADGSDAYNLELSKKRAEALINFFVSKGLSRDRIEIDFKGESNPIDSNDTPEGKQRNRRVDFSFI
jgi:outer membrane protein OmpA-like peptidoglycan-associated protein